MIPPGLVTAPNRHPVSETHERLLGSIAAHGMTVFAQIDHAAAAAAIGLKLRPTRVVIFGNPAAGTLLMQAVQTIGIDLPLRAMIWEDEAGATWVSHEDLGWLGERHGLGPETTTTMAHGLAAVIAQAIGPS